PIDEMISPSGDAGALGRIPVLEEFWIEMIAAFGGLDEGEADTCLARGVPVDVALPIGHVDALDRHGVGGSDALMRLGVAQRPGERVMIAGAQRHQRRRHGYDRDPTNDKRHRVAPQPLDPTTSVAMRGLKYFLPLLRRGEPELRLFPPYMRPLSHFMTALDLRRG